MEKLKGMTASIYRDADYSSSINKLKDAKQVTVVDKEMPELFEASDDCPPVRLVRRNLHAGEYIHAEPYEPGTYAFGGSFIFTSDSRLRKINQYPIPLHDRQMNLE